MINLQFESEGLPDDTFQVLQFHGEEEISHLFRFELSLVSRDPDIDFEKVLENHAKLAITTQGKTRYVHGMLSEFEQGGEWHSGIYEYRAVLVPRLWMMTQSQQNQIFQNHSIPDIIQSELEDLGDKGSHPLVMNGLGVADYEIYTLGNYEEREYVVQYKESDFNFISRLMEHEGIFYFFEQDELREKVIITDTAATHGSAEEIPVMFHTDAASKNYDQSVVYRLSRSQKQIPGQVLVKDWNYRRPDLPMQATSDVALEGVGGIGFVTEFGAHFKTPEEGERIASVRAQEFRCHQNIYSGESNIADFSCGAHYSLSQHFRTDYNREYMITRVVHHGSQEIESWGNVGGTSYYNQFSCIPADLPYRPQRLIPKPKLYGIMNGVIDSEQDMNRADIDELGRYKVMMPFDISGVAPGKASRRIRMAQPYGGGGAGMSFPLIKGTEVIWTCIDGDIDRPIITGVVPNPLNPSVTNTENNTSNVIKTTSGILMSFNDGAGSAAGTQSSGDGLAAQQQNQATKGMDIFSPFSGGIPAQELSLQQQESLALRDGWKVGEDIHEEDTNYQLLVPHGSSKTYLRMGSNCRDETITGVEISAGTGWVDYTDGDRLTVTQGKKDEYINGGNYSLNISNGALMESNASLMWHDSFTEVGGGVWRRFTVDWTCESHISLGDSEELIGGAKFEGFVGLATGINLGGSLTGTYAANVAVNGGYDFSFGSTQTNDLQENRLEITTIDHEMSAGNRVKINVKPADAATGSASNKAAIAGVTTIGAVATAAVAGVPLLVEAFDGDGADNIGATIANSALTGAAYGTATALHASLCAKALADVAAHKLDGAEAVELDMGGLPPRIRLGIGSGPTSTAMPGIDITPLGITIGFGPSSLIEISASGITMIAPKIDLKSPGNTTITSLKADIMATNGANIMSSGGPVSLTGLTATVSGSTKTEVM